MSCSVFTRSIGQARHKRYGQQCLLPIWMLSALSCSKLGTYYCLPAIKERERLITFNDSSSIRDGLSMRSWQPISFDSYPQWVPLSFYSAIWYCRTNEGMSISLQCAATITNTYAKYRHPSLLILNFSLAIFLFSMVVFFSVGNTRRLQCADAINPSTQDNNTLCAVQGKKQYSLSVFVSRLMIY